MSNEERDVEEVNKDMSAMHLDQKASVPVEFAYHVTNEIYTLNNNPTWDELQWTIADDPYYDGPLFGAPCVFFTTTLWKEDIPTNSVYPRKGNQNESYWFVKVPLNHFNDYRICHIPECDKGIQRKLLLVKEDEFKMIPQGVRANGDRYLRREKIESEKFQYYSNDYANLQTEYFVNIAVCHNVDLRADGVEWGVMQHREHKPGSPDKEALRKLLFDNFINRLPK